VGALAWPSVWSSALRPGQTGFNDYAGKCISDARLGTPDSPFSGLGLRLHQESASFLVHPESPIDRLLVDHATGTGKTLIILRMLDNYFDDPRPKVCIFPKERVVDNFYHELLKWPTRWREYFSFCNPTLASLASGAANWKRKRTDVWDLANERMRNEAKRRGCRLEIVVRGVVDAVRDVLEMKKSICKGKVRAKFTLQFLKDNPGAPAPRAPLRAFRYTTAGGSAAELGDDGWPRSPILKVGFDKNELNPYSGKFIIMDEIHNLVRPNQMFEEQLGRLRDCVAKARGSVLAGFTGTPVGNDAKECRLLVDVIKGPSNGNDEGFISSFHARDSADFPREEPIRGIPDGILHEGMFSELVKKHVLHGEALKRYLLKDLEMQTVPRLMRLPEEKKASRLANYCNLHVHYGSFSGAARSALLKDVKSHAPKMYHVARAIAKQKEKAVVMLSATMGFKAMLEVLRKAGKKLGYRVATLGELSDFNDAKRNLRGERFRVLVAETSQAGEGVSFRHVRRVHLVDVPLRHNDLVQRVSRCVRLGGHQELPEAERTLAVEIHAVQLPKFLRQGPGSLIYRELLNAKEVVATPGECLENATMACLEELKRHEVKTVADLQRVVQGVKGVEFIELITETALEHLGVTSKSPARPLAMALWRLQRGGDDLEHLESALLNDLMTADEKNLQVLVDKSAELLPSLEVMRFGAVDRPLLKQLGDPPRAPPPRSETVNKRAPQALSEAQCREPIDVTPEIDDIFREEEASEPREERDLDIGELEAELSKEDGDDGCGQTEGAEAEAELEPAENVPE